MLPSPFTSSTRDNGPNWSLIMEGPGFNMLEHENESDKPRGRSRTVHDWMKVSEYAKPLAMFAFVFGLQVGHLLEHVTLALSGNAFLGPEADTQLFHYAFNTLILFSSAILVRTYSRNPWTYVLLIVAGLHEAEDTTTYVRFVLQSHVLNGLLDASDPGLMGIGGTIGLLPLRAVDLHNLYNGLEWILVTLGFWHEVEAISTGETTSTEELAS